MRTIHSNTVLICCCFLLLFQTKLSAISLQEPRQKLNFNTNWAFHRGEVNHAEAIGFNDRAWEAVTIPHVMRLEKKHNGGAAIYQGIGWYRRYFNLSNSLKNKRLSIHFEGVQMNCDVYLNGKKLTSHFGGYMGFSVDITPHVKFGQDNVLALKVTNTDDPLTPPGKPMQKLDFNYYGGIYRNVSLLATEKIYVSDALEANKVAGGGLLINYTKVDKKQAILSVQSHIVNGSDKMAAVKIWSILKDKNNQEVARVMVQNKINAHGEHTFQQEMKISNPKLWHPEHPYLYHLESLVYREGVLTDKLLTRTGIRSIAFKSATGKADGFYLNGEKLYLRGANRHQAYQYVGDAASDGMQVRDVKLIKAGGFNSLRAAHYPASAAFLDACDELGLLVIQCQPGWQFFNQDPVFVNRSFQDIREMIRRDRNRPSVFLWETSLNESPTPASWMKDAVAIAHQEMPGDQFYTADDMNSRSKDVYDVLYKVVNPDGTDPMPNSPSFTREWGDAWFSDASKENSLRASRIYSAKGMINQARLRQNALNGETSEDKGGYWDHAGLDANPRMGGYFLWSFNDYTRGSDSITAFSGVVDIDRYPKFGYYQMQSMQRPNKSNPAMVFVASYNNRPDLDASIMVFSNCDAVKLYRNGQFMQQITRAENAKTAPHIFSKEGSPYYTFHLGNYQAGELKAEGLMNGKVVVQHQIRTAKKPAQLAIELGDKGVPAIADGSEMIPVYIKVLDDKGTLIANQKGLEYFELDLEVSGEGTLITETAPGAEIMRTEGGLAYALIRTTKKAGEICISAKSKNLKSARLSFNTLASDANFVSDGKHAVWNNTYGEAPADAASNDTSKTTARKKLDLKNATVSILNHSSAQVNQAIDDNINTVWQAENTVFPMTLTIDLKQIYQLSDYQIFWGKDSDWYTHTIQVSEDNLNWMSQTENSEISGQDYGLKKLKSSNIRYLKLTISAIRPEKSKIAIREILLFTKLR
ncbi:glycoside hydrolase family 2 TIM barrel-domain containing protein [Pedobacter gandavensis]|uniref:glycoside hydrolase family 2 TIM barrel-domain containing protein n=1 Tax=Pedobacter gandavensis TaxID=2679963 RepID=UPI0029302864|nr:glycoside hydrolase family 2 TIM barrel-domain containing protein [Pedobacter gandavensis]